MGLNPQLVHIWALLFSFLTLLLFLARPGGKPIRCPNIEVPKADEKFQLVSVKHEIFKTCDQSGFCKRNRALADTATAAGSLWTSPYVLDSKIISFKDGQLQGMVLKNITENGSTVRLPLTISFLRSGSARVTLDEEKRMKGDIKPRHGSKIRMQRYNEAAQWALVGGLDVSKTASAVFKKNDTRIFYGPQNKFEAVIQYSPFAIYFKRDDKVQVKLNSKGFMSMEHWRPRITKEEKDGKEQLATEENSIADMAVDDSTWWEETFGGNTDSKPRGPESVGMDIVFPGYSHVYGIPEHTGPLSLKETRGGPGNYDQPYRMYNTDVFEYEIDSPVTLYGSIPFMQAHRKDSTVGIFWLNAAETWVDIVKSKMSSHSLNLGVAAKVDTQTHWFSESGVLDMFVFLGPSPKDVLHSYSELTGNTQLPQQFAIAYHQCRWNYVTDEDVKDVDRKFDRSMIPYDVIWLDIEYADGKKYFTWDSLNFVDPLSMQKQLDEHDRKLVAIIDPHLKNDDGYWVSEELKSKGLAIKNKDNNIYEGWCWPGSSHWPDLFNPAAISWWQNLFSYTKFKGSAPNTFIWNDMNEPSVFNGPDATMPKDCIHHDDWEHRDVHNVNGVTVVNATFDGLLKRNARSPRRPFILTRSFYAGSQRLGAFWTGDNRALWDHLAASLPMILAHNIAGFPFGGADVGGFFGNPSKELLTRWYQAGVFYPFFRAHAHIDSRRREPYLAGKPYTAIITQALRLRYQLLPAWYTVFHETSVDNSPIVRPQYYVHPSDEKGFNIDDQMYIGSTGLLVKPVISEGAESVDVYISDEETYYDYFDYTIYSGAGKTRTVPAPMEKIPLLMQGGHIIPRKDRPRKSSGLMKWDPYTLLIVLNNTGNAAGEIYIDDGETFDYEQGAYIQRKFHFNASKSILTSEDAGTVGKQTKEYLKTMARVRVEKILIVGPPASWRSKSKAQVFEDGAKVKQVPMTWHDGVGQRAAWAVVRDPGVSIGKTWKIDFS